MACQQEKLEAAREAYHRLVTGKAVRVTVDQNGERVEFAVANASRLQAYIQQLEAECAAAATPLPRKPFAFIF